MKAGLRFIETARRPGFNTAKVDESDCVPEQTAMEIKTPGHSILILEGSDFQRRVCRWVGHLADVLVVKDPDALLESLDESTGATILLELSLVDTGSRPVLETLFKRGADHRIVVVTDDQAPDALFQLFRRGARGFLPSALSEDLLIKALQAIQDGELWIGRKLTGYLMSRVILERDRRPAKVGLGQVGNRELTPRELEIARYVAKGKSDKVIARELSISHHTVKNHMSRIFDKLQVADRYQLALLYHGIDVN